MTTHNRKSNQRKGTVTALILLVSFILMILGMSTILISMHERTFAVRSAQVIGSKAAADSGLTEAIHRFNSMLESQSVDLSLLDVSGVSLPNSDATYDYTVTEGDPGEYQFVSTGHAQGTSRTVTANLSLHGLFENAVGVKNELSLFPGSQVVGINSLDAFDTDLDVTMGTVSTGAGKIPMGPGTVINGNVFVGVGGVPSDVITGSGTVTGDQYALPEEIVFPVVTPPSFGITQPAITASGDTVILTPGDSGRYSGVDISRAGPTPGELKISGGQVVLHITGDFSLDRFCEMVIEPGASLILYLDGDYLSDMGSAIENKNDPKALQIIATGTGTQHFEFKPKVETFGLIYAPNAIIEVWPQSDLKGSIVAYDFIMLSGGMFTYDKAVQQVSINDPGVRLVLDNWSE